jgi:hypothetical protein
MLSAFYSAIFRPTERRTPDNQVAWLIGGLVILILAFNAAGAIGAGTLGLLTLVLVFAFAGLLGLYWLSASVHLLAIAMGGHGTIQATVGAIVQGLWPLLLTGPAIAAMDWSVRFGQLFSIAVSLGVYVTLVIAIQRAHHLGWLQAFLCLAITLAVSVLALTGLILWPLMVFWGM